MDIDRTPPPTLGRTIDARFEVIDASDDLAWTAALSQVAQHDFHHLAGYHRLAEYRGEGAARLFVYRENGHVIALPLLLRPLAGSDPGGAHDATSVYGYAGPVASDSRVPKRIVGAFQALLREELERQQVIAVFSRLHPLIEQDHLLAGLGAIRPTGHTVAVDLTIPQEAQWAGYSRGLRRLIRRGLEAGVDCIHDQDLVYLPEWASIYAETMERVGASSALWFDAAYFARMVDELGSTLHLFMACVDGRPVAGGLFTAHDGIVEAHLGGSREGYSAFSPVRIIDDTARRWAAESGARVFHLGGGVGGRQDSLFQYKAAFSDQRHVFATWRWVVDAEAYDYLCRQDRAAREPAGGEDGASDYFPAYRRPIDD